MTDETDPEEPDAAGPHTAPDGPPRPAGILATWRQTPAAARALLAGILVNRLAGFLQIFLVLFLTHRGFSANQAGLALGVYGAGGVLGTFVGGYLTDWLSARRVTLVSMMGSAVLLVSIVYVRIYLLILLAVLLVSTVGLLYRPAAQSLLIGLTPRSQIVMVTAMYRLCLNLGTSVAPLLGVALAAVSYNLLFWAEALGALAYGIIALLILPRETAPAAGPAPDGKESPPAPRGRLLADQRYLVFLGAFALIMLVYCQYTAALPLAIARAGIDLWWYGAVITINAVIVVLCEVPATKVVQGWPMRKTQLAGWGLVAVGYSIYGIGITPFLLVLGTVVWTASEVIGAPTTYAYPGMVAPEHLRGRYFGAMQTVFGLGSTLGPILGVELFDHVGRWVWLWAAGAAALATIVVPLGMRSPARSAERAVVPSVTDPVTPAEADIGDPVEPASTSAE